MLICARFVWPTLLLIVLKSYILTALRNVAVISARQQAGSAVLYSLVSRQVGVSFLNTSLPRHETVCGASPRTPCSRWLRHWSASKLASKGCPFSLRSKQLPFPHPRSSDSGMGVGSWGLCPELPPLALHSYPSVLVVINRRFAPLDHS